MNYRMVSLLAVLLASSGVMWGAQAPSVRFRAPKDGDKIINQNKATFCFDRGGITAYSTDAFSHSSGSYTLSKEQISQLIEHSKSPTIMTVKSENKGPIKCFDIDKKSFQSAHKCSAVYNILNPAAHNNIDNICLLGQNADMNNWEEAAIINSTYLNLGSAVKMNAELVDGLKEIFAADTATTNIGIHHTQHGRYYISRKEFEARFPLSNDPKKDSPSQQGKSSVSWLSNKWSNASWSQLCVGGVSFAAILAAIYYYCKK